MGAGDSPFTGTAGAAARSLNRARIEVLPGIAVEPDILGRAAGDLLSAAAWRALLGQAAAALSLDPADPDLFFAFNTRFDHPAARDEARRLAERMGRRLGYLLLMLVRGEEANRAARPDWNAAHWAYWHEVAQVIIAGGLWAGKLGAAGLPAARAVLREAGCSLALYRSPSGPSLPLLGLARHAPPDTGRMLLFDLGHTNVKRGTAIYRDGRLIALVPMPTLATPRIAPAPAGQALDEARTRWRWMLDLIAADWHHLDRAVPRELTAVGISLATHLEAGHPLDADRGIYGRMAGLAPHLATFMRDELAAALGPFRSFALLHDGLAAASAYAGRSRTAVLVLGTSIGVGYAPSDNGLRPCSII